MKSYELKPEQKDFAFDIARQVNLGNRGRNDGELKHQYAGILAEVVMADLMGMERKTVEGYQQGGSDNGIDFVIGGKNIDLKVRTSTYDWKPYFSNNLMRDQVDNPYSLTHVLLFAVINTTKSTIQFNGWLKKNEIKHAWLHRKGEARPRGKSEPLILPNDTYEIPNSALKEFHPMTFENEMNMFALTDPTMVRYNIG